MTQAATSTRAWTEMKPSGKGSVPEGLWMRCPGCAAMIYRRQVEASGNVCPECGHHFRISATQRVEQLIRMVPDVFAVLATDAMQTLEEPAVAGNLDSYGYWVAIREAAVYAED